MMTQQGQDKHSYRDTLNITLNDRDPGAFQQRGNLPAREPEFQKRWDEAHIYEKSVQRPSPRGKFVLHDGPPYSNGPIHLGTALNKITKDFVTRFRSMVGYAAPYVPGWDNHGMPIENAVAQQFRQKKLAMDRVALRRACREYAAGWIDVQRQQFKRLGVRGQWDDPYLTMSPDFESSIVEVFGELASAGYIYRGLRPVLWCATCETALADAEVEYEEHASNSIYVRFPILEDPNGVLPENTSLANSFVLIWTTTPWTIPANLAVAVHPDAEYCWIETAGEIWLVAAALQQRVLEAVDRPDARLLSTVRGSELSGLVARHPLFDRPSPVLLADYVTMDAGTGAVHTAPGHGKEDFETGQKFGLQILCPVDASGRFTDEAGSGVYGESPELTPFKGLRVTTFGRKGESEADPAVMAALANARALVHNGRFEHSYPHCWRCHSPLIFRATLQWFLNVDHDSLRERMLDAIASVKWYPAPSVNRISSMIASGPDWCLSRQRSWGVGIPAFHCTSCGEAVLDPEAIRAVAKLVADEGSDAWYERSAAQILPESFRCPHCSAPPSSLRNETDVLDVWFDSGSTCRAVLENTGHWPLLSRPADLYLEGGDQHRGWFNSSLKVSVATRGEAPYRAVVTNGWTLDEQGHAMHKSRGNAVDPVAVVEKSGADVLRWWVASTDFMEDVTLGDGVLAQIGESYRRVRNTFRFLLNNLYDFEIEKDGVEESELDELDQWALAHLGRVTRTAVAAYEKYEFHRVHQVIHHFCAVELSSFYLDILKDRLYASGKTSKQRRSAQTVLHRLAHDLARLVAPVLVHTAEEVWDHLRLPGKEESVHLASMPEAPERDEEILTRWLPVLSARETVMKALAGAREAGVVKNPLEARVVLRAGADVMRGLSPFVDQLSTLFVVSQVELLEQANGAALSAEVKPGQGNKCARCWLLRPEVGTAHPDLCQRCAEVAGQ